MHDIDASEEVRAYYELNARVYRIFSRFYDAVTLPVASLRREVVRFSGASSMSRVLDVATGTGAQAFAFATTCQEVVGVDISDAMLDVARRKRSAPNLEYQHADAVALPFEDGRFDVASISFALHEMPATVRRAALSEMARVVRPAGSVVVVDYARRPGVFGRAAHRAIQLFERDHYAEFVQSDLRALMESVGLRVADEHHAVFGLARMLLAQKRY